MQIEDLVLKSKPSAVKSCKTSAPDVYAPFESTLSMKPWEQWGFVLRGEALDPDTQASGDLVHEAGIGVAHYVLPGGAEAVAPRYSCGDERVD